MGIGEVEKAYCVYALESMAGIAKEVENRFGRQQALNVVSKLVRDFDLDTAGRLIKKDCEPNLSTDQLMEHLYSDGNTDAGYVPLNIILGYAQEILNCDTRYGEMKFQHFVRQETEEEVLNSEHDPNATWFMEDDNIKIDDLILQFELE